MDSESISKKRRRRSPSSEESSDRSHSRSRSRSRSRSERKKSKKSKKQKSSKNKSEKEKKEKSSKQTKSKKDTKKKDRRRSRSRSESSPHREIKKPIHPQMPMEMPFNPYLMYQKFMLPRDPRLMFPMGGFNRMGFQQSMGAPMVPQSKPIEPVQMEQPTDKIVKDQNFLNSDEKLFDSIVNNEISIKSIFEQAQISEYLAGPYLYKVVKKIVHDPTSNLESLSKSLSLSVLNSATENNPTLNNSNMTVTNIHSNQNINYPNSAINLNANNINLSEFKNICSNNSCINDSCGNNNSNNCSLMHSIALNSELGQDGISTLNANLIYAPKSNEILKHAVESFISENTRKKCIDMGDMNSIREALYKYRNRHFSDELNQLI